jgi:CheY-like chemotaxis protein
MSKVLLVEDDINLRDIYSARFMAEAYEVITASDGEEALATAVREKPDLIVLDVMMPKISGFDVLDILRSTPETKFTKIIMMTALSQDTDRARGEALGVNRYLIKSQVTLEDVVTAVRDILGGTSAPAAPVAATPAPQAVAAPESLPVMAPPPITTAEPFLTPDVGIAGASIAPVLPPAAGTTPDAPSEATPTPSIVMDPAPLLQSPVEGTTEPPLIV